MKTPQCGPPRISLNSRKFEEKTDSPKPHNKAREGNIKGKSAFSYSGWTSARRQKTTTSPNLVKQLQKRYHHYQYPPEGTPPPAFRQICTKQQAVAVGLAVKLPRNIVTNGHKCIYKAAVARLDVKQFITNYLINFTKRSPINTESTFPQRSGFVGRTGHCAK